MIRIRGAWTLIFFLVCCRVQAAGGNAQIVGAVTDGTGVPAPLAGLTIFHRESGASRVLTAGADGKYEVSDLPAGTYLVTARSVRNHSFASISVVLQAGQHIDLPIQLSAIWLETKSVSSSNIPSAHQSFSDFIHLEAGITAGEEGGDIEGFGPYGIRGDVGFNSNGIRSQANSYVVDGMDNNESLSNGALLIPSLEFTENVHLLTTYIPVDFGHTSGAVVNVQTRSGQNQIHGSAFEYFQNTVLRARNFFDGPQAPGLAMNQFGGTLGGPIRRNRSFFFLGADSLRERDGLTVISTVPTALEKTGDFGVTPIYEPLSLVESGSIVTRTQFPGNRVPASLIPLQARNLMGLYPNPNLPGVADNYRFAPDLDRNNNRFDFRADQILSERSLFFVRGDFERLNERSPGSLAAPAALNSLMPFAGSDPTQQANDERSKLTQWGGAISHTLALTPRVLNSFRAGITGTSFQVQPLDAGLDALAVLAIPGLGSGGLPSVSPLGYAALGAAESVPLGLRTANFELNDGLTLVLGKHTLEFGAEIFRRHADGDATEWTSRGTFLFTPDYTSLPGDSETGNAIASLLTGYPSETRRDVQFSDYRLREWEWSGFVTDEVKIGRRLTIQAGIRYSLLPPVTEASNHMVNFNFSRDQAALSWFAGKDGVNAYAGVHYNALAFAPRAAVAYDLSGNGTTILRGAFSTTFDTGAMMMQGMLARNAPWAENQDFLDGSFFTGTHSLTDGIPAPIPMVLDTPQALNQPNFAINAVEHGAFTPYTDQWGLVLQHHLGSGLVMEFGGTASMGMHLLEAYDTNTPLPGAGPLYERRYGWNTPNLSRIDYLSSGGGSTYYGGQAKLSGHVRRDLQMAASWTFAKAEDDATEPMTGQDSRPSGPQNINGLRSVRSASPFDVARRLVVVASYQMPAPSGRLRPVVANWQLDTVIAAQSGMPFTPELPVNSLNDGGYHLPNRVGAGSLPADQRTWQHWFNTALDSPGAAFVTPGLYDYGNSGYDIVRGPGQATVDAALSRKFAVTEKLDLQLRAEAFNLLNQTNFALPNRFLGLDASGFISHTSTPARHLELVVRMQW